MLIFLKAVEVIMAELSIKQAKIWGTDFVRFLRGILIVNQYLFAWYKILEIRLVWWFIAYLAHQFRK